MPLCDLAKRLVGNGPSRQSTIATGPGLFHGKAQITAATNEPESVDVYLAIAPVVPCGMGRHRQNASLLVVPDCDDLNARLFREFSDTELFFRLRHSSYYRHQTRSRDPNTTDLV